MTEKKKSKTKSTDSTDILSAIRDIHGKMEGLEIHLHNKIDVTSKDLERQIQDQRADIHKMKEEILGAFDASARLPDVSSKV
ncbi:MAG: hypothetical protein SGI74_04825 [Oligoflexia bacterium]|nr:hypothetical protein [Oligoflexia bacterium]